MTAVSCLGLTLSGSISSATRSKSNPRRLGRSSPALEPFCEAAWQVRQFRYPYEAALIHERHHVAVDSHDGHEGEAETHHEFALVEAITAPCGLPPSAE